LEGHTKFKTKIVFTDQKEMITRLPKEKALYVEGGFRIWLREAQVSNKTCFGHV
jgi:hypothetical protein